MYLVQLTEKRQVGRTRRQFGLYRCTCGREFERKIAKSLLQQECMACANIKVGRLNRKSAHHVITRKVMETYIRNAREKNREFTLTVGQFQKLIFSNCAYCGIPPSQHLPLVGNYTPERLLEIHTVKYNGVDQIHAGKGYTLENCAPCCRTCNFGKQQLTPEQYVEHCKLVVHFQSQFNEKRA